MNNDEPQNTEDSLCDLEQPSEPYLKRRFLHMIKRTWPPKGSNGGTAAGSVENDR